MKKSVRVEHGILYTHSIEKNQPVEQSLVVLIIRAEFTIVPRCPWLISKFSSFA